MISRLWIGAAGGAYFWVFADSPQQAERLLRESDFLPEKDWGLFSWRRLESPEEFTYSFDDGTQVKLSARQWGELFDKQSAVLATSEI